MRRIVAGLVVGIALLLGSALSAQQVPDPRAPGVGSVGYVLVENATEIGGEVVGGTVISSHSQLNTALDAMDTRQITCGGSCVLHVRAREAYRSVMGYSTWPSSPTPPVTQPPVTQPPPVDPNPAGVVFRSYWSTGTGMSDNAIRDGGAWNDWRRGNNSQVLEVVSGAPVGWTFSPNVLQVTNRGETQYGLLGSLTAIPANANEIFIRFYVRMGNLRNGNTYHSVKNSFSPRLTYWAIHSPTTTSYRPMVRSDGSGAASGLADYGYQAPALQVGQWYRFEMRVHFYDTANPLRFRLYPHVYTMAGALVADASGYMAEGEADPRPVSLATHYSRGGYMVAASRDLARHLHLGYESTGGNNDVGARWYYAGVEVRTDRFPGALGN